MMPRHATPRDPHATLGLIWLAVAASLALPATAPAQFTTDFRLEDCVWSANGTQNPYFKLRPGYRLVLEGEEEDGGQSVQVQVQITVLRELEKITFLSQHGAQITVNARVVEERESKDGELVEVSRNWFARCQHTSDIYYFGESVDNYDGGQVVNHNGSWRAGVDGALPGLIMPGTFLLGAKYFQEMAPGVALDRGKNVAMGLRIETDAGVFEGCVKVLDTDALKPGEEGDEKVYCPGIGLVRDEDISLTDYGVVP